MATLCLCCCAWTFSSCGKLRAQTSHCSGFSYCRAWALGCVGFSNCSRRAQWLWYMGVVVQWHVQSSRTRDRTCVLCIGWRILNHWASRGVLELSLNPCPCDFPTSPCSHFNENLSKICFNGTLLSKHGATRSSLLLLLWGQPCEHNPLSGVCLSTKEGPSHWLEPSLLGQNCSVVFHLPIDTFRGLLSFMGWWSFIAL